MVSCRVCPHEGLLHFACSSVQGFQNSIPLRAKGFRPEHTQAQLLTSWLIHQPSLETPSRDAEKSALLISASHSLIQLTVELNHCWLVEHLSGMHEAVGSMPSTRLCVCSGFNENGPHRFTDLNTWSLLERIRRSVFVGGSVSLGEGVG